MSNKDDNSDAAPANPEAERAPDDVAAIEPPADDTPDEPAEPADAVPSRPTGARGGILGLLGLAAGAVALLGVVWLYLTRETLPDLDFAAPADIRAVGDSVAALEAAIGELEGRLDTLSASDDSAADSRRQLERALRGEVDTLSQRVDGLESVPPRVGNLENAVAAIQGIEAGARDTLLLAEAEHYLRTANSLLNLAGDAALAGVALGMANDRLTAIGNPALDNVRQTITDEITALELTAAPDIESNAMLLSSLARLVDSLPLKTVDGNLTASSAAAEAADEPGAAGRAWNAVKEAVGGAITITPPGGDNAPLLVPGTEPPIRANLSLQLQAARLALLKGEQSVFEQSLDDAAEWLEQYFDGASLQVQSARTTLSEVRDSSVTGDRPDISESLRLLRQYRSLSE